MNIILNPIQFIKIHFSTSQKLHITNMNIPHKYSTPLSQTEEDLIISSTFATITNVSNTIITADANAHLPLWHLLPVNSSNTIII